MYLPFDDSFRPKTSTVEFIDEVKTLFERTLEIYRHSIESQSYNEDSRYLKFSFNVSNIGCSEAVLQDSK